MIDRFTLSELAASAQGHLIGGDCRFSSVSTDSRAMHPDALFVALRGVRFDGHRFAGAAVDAGAVALLVDQPVHEVPTPQCVVADTRAALGVLGRQNRERAVARRVGITGSCGKTSCRSLVASVLAEAGKVLATEGNFNNEIGVPLTLLRLEAQHDFAVLELGASARGEIARTALQLEPEIAVITNAGSAHLEGFGSHQGIVEAKGELLDALAEHGVAVLNRDDLAFGAWSARARPHRVISFSMEQAADVYATDVRLNPQGAAQFSLHLAGEDAEVRLQLLGRHMVSNAVAAAAVGMHFGLSLEQVRAGLEQATPMAGRVRRLQGRQGAVVIDDSYNANPASVRAAIELLSAAPGTRILVLGALGELGDSTLSALEETGRLARTLGIEHLVAVGTAAPAGAAFGKNAVQAMTTAEAAALVLDLMGENTQVLVKGSRSARLDEVVAELVEGGA